MKDSELILNKLREEAKNHLPGLVGEQLQEVLADYERLKEEYKTLEYNKNTLIDQRDKEIKNNRALSEENILIKSKAGDLDKREAEVSARESEAKLRERILELKEKHADQRIEDNLNVVGLIFRNTELRKTMFDKLDVETPDQYGNSLNSINTRQSSVTEIKG